MYFTSLALYIETQLLVVLDNITQRSTEEGKRERERENVGLYPEGRTCCFFVTVIEFLYYRMGTRTKKDAVMFDTKHS